MRELKKLRELREKRGLTLDQVAEELGLRNQYVSNYELGKRRPDYETLKKFADFYGVTIDYILEREELNTNQEYLRVMKKAEKDGFTPSEIESALDFLRGRRKRNETRQKKARMCNG